MQYGLYKKGLVLAIVCFFVVIGFFPRVTSFNLLQPPDDYPPVATIVSITPNPAIVGEEVTFRGIASDPEEYPMYLEWDFGDGEKEAKTSGSFERVWFNTTHEYSTPDSYIVNFTCIDIVDQSDSEKQEVQVINNPPNTPTLPGGLTGLDIGESGTFTTNASDPDGHKVCYRFDWDADGAGNISSWTSLGASGHTGSLSHSWSNAETYVVKAQAKDEYDELSGWSTGLTVTVNEPNRMPYQPGDPSPSNHATDVDIDSDLSWTGGDPDEGDTVTYDVYFGSMLPLVKVASNISATSYDPGTLANSLTYFWSIVAWDNHGASTQGPGWDFTTISENKPPMSPSIDGPNSGKVGERYCWIIHSADPNGDSVYYYIDWGDGTYIGWIGPCPSCTPVEVCHTYKKQGNYTIKAKAKDMDGLESDWATLSVSMPRNRIINRPFLQFLQNFLQQYPILYQLLQRVLRL